LSVQKAKANIAPAAPQMPADSRKPRLRSFSTRMM
jgi:hypothetical protein